MRRREFIKGIVGSATAWPLLAVAQEPGRVYRVGFLYPFPRDAPEVAAFFDELKANGFVEGQNLSVLPGGFEVPIDQLDEVADTMVRAAPDAIVAGPDPVLRAIQARTRTIPIVGMSEDMVAGGFVASLAHPGSNTTGISLLSPELDGKRQEILLEALPDLHRITAFADATYTHTGHLDTLRDAARSQGVELSTVSIAKPGDIAPAIDAAKASGTQALNFLATPLFVVNRRIVFERAAAVRLPAIYQWPDMAEQGGLMAYGPRLMEVYRQRARLLVRVLRGTKPDDIPVEQPTRFELVINLKTAQAIGLTISESFLARADEVIE
jgi:putative ABC transport system substrate-binding protein